jgi:putative membrane protein insertion efficiency factor
MLYGLIAGYQRFISPFLPMSCRFHPSCSAYAWSAIAHYGVVKGLWKALGRLLRCHPWSDGGYDPVLPNKENS